MFRFAHPEMFWLLATIILVVGAWIVSAFSRRRRLARFGEKATIAPLMADASPRRGTLKTIFLVIAIALIVCALARPQVGSKLREVTVSGAEIMLAVDVSNSMLAQDFSPSRLERTKYAIERLLDELEQDRVGLVVFAGDAYVQLPITSDHLVAQSFTRQISPSMVSRQGTAIGAAIDLAASGFSSGAGLGGGTNDDNEPARNRAIILITDGENHEDDALAAARRAADEGIRIYTIGIGTPEGAPIEVDGEFIRDEEGEMVVSRLDEAVLRQIAAETDGAYIRSTPQSIGLQEIASEINSSVEGESRALMFEEWGELYGWFLGSGLVFLLVGWALLSRKNRLLGRLRI